MNVLVTGGTGFVGSHLVPRLVLAGHAVRVLARGRHHLSLPSEVAISLGDVLQSESLEAALDGVDAVVHLVAIIRQRPPYTFTSVNHQGTLNLVQAMSARGILRLIHISALGASDDRRFAYTHSKWLGEQEVVRSKLDYTVFRPSLMVGPGGFVGRLRSSLAPLPIFAPIPGSGTTRFQPIWVEDVVTCILLSLTRSGTVGRTIEVGGPEYLTYEEMVDGLLRALALRRIKLHVPLALMDPAVAVMQRLLPDPPVTQAELAQLEVDNVTSLDAVPAHFGFQPARFEDKLPSAVGLTAP